MHVLIDADGRLSLEDANNFKGFSIVESKAGIAAANLGEMAEPAEDNHYWLQADAVIALSPHGSDQSWIDAFWDMLKKVEKYGYSDLDKGRVKAHVEQTE